METQQMAMPAEMAAQGPNPEEMAIYEQMRQQISPQEFSNEMLAGASQVDPQAVAEFTEELRGLDVSPEELDALNDLVDQILANPEQYDQLRQQFLAQGMPDDILPEQFDPYFFAALNMAVDQMIAAPTGVQAFAKGGIAELKPIAKAIASYGRNGDTMLAHITPAEARMLKRRGGSGTINPATGLPEFFLKKAFKSIGKAVKKFASSSVGRLVTTVALGYFLGPMAAKAMGIASGTMAAAAVSGFVGGAGGSLLAGGNLKDALRSGAIAGLTAGAAAGLGGASLTGADAPAAVPGLNASGSSVAPGAPAISATGEVANMATVPTPGSYSDLPMTGTPVKPFTEFFGDQASAAATAPAADPLGNFIQQNEALRTAANTPVGGQTSLVDQTKDFYTRNTPTAIKEAAIPGAQKAAANAVAAAEKTIPANITGEARAAMLKTTYDKAFNAAMPGTLATYGPTIAAGTGIMALAGGFDSKPVQGGDITQSLMKSSEQRMREQGTQRLNYLQNLPGVAYDQFGEPIAGQNTRFPTYDVPNYNLGGFDNSFGQGIMDLPAVYIPPPGTIGARRVEQPFNNSDMYSNLVPRRFASGGAVSEGTGSTRFSDAQVASYIQNNALSGAALQQAAQVFQLAPDQIARAQSLLAGNDPSVLAASNVYSQQVAGRPDLVAENLSFYNASTGTGTGLTDFQEAEKVRIANLTAEQRLAEENRLRQAEATRIANLTAEQRLAEQKAAQERAAAENAAGANRAAIARQREGRDKANQQRAMRLSQGSGQMYANINAGLSALAPETNPMNMGDTGFGARNRVAQLNALNQTYGPMLQGQRSAMTEQARILGTPFSQAPVGTRTLPSGVNQSYVDQLVKEAAQQAGGTLSFADASNAAGGLGIPNSMLTSPLITDAPRLLNMGGIAGLAQGGYPRRTGQISGPGTEKSDSIPAMLSDGEFVMTAGAVRGADPTGKGNRRAGAKQMYKLMHQLEKNSERG